MRLGLKAPHLKEVDQVADGLASGFVERDTPGVTALTNGGRQVKPLAGPDLVIIDMDQVEAGDLSDTQPGLSKEADERVIAGTEG
jgi:hypothetical protein